MLDVRPVRTDAARESGRSALDAAARKLTGAPAEQREIEKSLAPEIASAAGSQGGQSGDDRPEYSWPFGPRRRRDPALLRHAPPAGRIVRGRCSHDL
jgi:hypothetical protein